MNIQAIKEIAKKKGIMAGKLNKTDLIRTIQKAEGNYDCFASSQADKCGQAKCLWRKDCANAV